MLFLASCTYAEKFKDCQINCKPHFFVGFDHKGGCLCSPVEIECKQKNKVNLMIKNFMQKIASNLIIMSHEGLSHHVKNSIPLADNIYRSGSDQYFSLYKYARLAGVCISPEDKWYLKSDIGKFASYRGEKVPLDYPFEVTAAEYKGKDVELNKPKRGGSKKFYVYVKDGDRVVKVSFGQPGVSIKNGDDDARKSFLARHRCHECKAGSTKCPKTSARYWSCNVHRYAKQLGLKSTKPW